MSKDSYEDLINQLIENKTDSYWREKNGYGKRVPDNSIDMVMSQCVENAKDYWEEKIKNDFQTFCEDYGFLDEDEKPVIGQEEVINLINNFN